MKVFIVFLTLAHKKSGTLTGHTGNVCRFRATEKFDLSRVYITVVFVQWPSADTRTRPIHCRTCSSNSVQNAIVAGNRVIYASQPKLCLIKKGWGFRSYSAKGKLQAARHFLVWASSFSVPRPAGHLDRLNPLSTTSRVCILLDVTSPRPIARHLFTSLDKCKCNLLLLLFSSRKLIS